MRWEFAIVRVWAVGISLIAGAALGGGSPVSLEASQVAREFDQRSWRHEHGLPADRVWALCQTRDGYLWVATQKGLARFDGERFTVFDRLNTPQFVNEECRALAEDAEGHLWISTGDGIVLKAGGTFTRFDAATGLEATEFPVLTAGTPGGVWAGGLGTLCHIQNGHVRKVPLPSPLTRAVSLALSDDDARLWIGMSAGLFWWDKAHEQLEKDLVNEGKETPVIAMWRSPQNELWVLVSESLPYALGSDPRLRLRRVREGRWLEEAVPGAADFPADARSRFLVGDAFGALWVPALGNGIHRYVDGQLQLLPLPRDNRMVVALCAMSDREGNLWIGTESHGLIRWTPRRVTTLTVQDGLAHDNAWSVFEASDGSILVGTDGGVSRWSDGRFTPLTRHDGTPISQVRAVVEDVAGAVWVGTMRSLECLRPGEASTITLPGEWFESKVRALHASRDGTVWVGTVRGLTRLRQGERRKYSRADGLGSDEVRAILESRSGDLWVGTLGGGLSRLSDGRFTTLRRSDGLCSDNVWVLHEDETGVLWIGTDAGLNRLHEGHVTIYGLKEGLPEWGINGLTEDNHGRLWMGTDRGIYWIEKGQLEEVARGVRRSVQAVRYDETDGMLSAETNGQKSNPVACKARDGRLWFPTTRGVVVIDPTRVVADRVEPLASLELARANGRSLMQEHESVIGRGSGSRVSETARGFLLPPGGARVLEFRYVAKTFLAPEKARYRYRLVGLDEHWIDAGPRREAFFTDLRPGAYRFEVVAGNHRGVWQSEPTALNFSVGAFFYQKWWFYVMALGLVAGGGVGVAAWRIREVRRIHELERANALNLQRQQIARDIHDELGAALTHILQLSTETRFEGAQAGQVQQRVQHIADLAGEAVDHIGEIVWANNPAFDTLEDLVAYLREYAANFFAGSSVALHLAFPEDVPARTVGGLWRRHLILLLKEALQNVVKHAGAAKVHVALDLNDGALRLLVADDGCGLPPEGSRRDGNGMAHMRQRIAELDGRLDVRSRPGQGTEVCAIVPLPADMR